MPQLSKIFLLLGILFTVLGLLMFLADKIPFLGKLPGDFYIERENVTFFLPLTSSIIVSIIVSIILNLFLRR